ncbi:Glu/Leu/Phe/Val dehydrogenase family protein [Flagellimonas meishanensis]|uniref:Glu/Leu/Phe/Val dehydrogenase family protein n=1 Tax=Flagellimonas meishanensis TaxID=2873264 RepID=UPI001CA5FDD4|nr:Glu/Leu/Phe/Val dehydrogenase family protein [[Muricauda] meishanensis]
MKNVIKTWDGQFVITNYDEPTDSWIFIAVHSNALGPATGGTRMMMFESHEQGLWTALRLAEDMTYKFALANFPRGGGKAVISISQVLSKKEKRGLLLRYGKILKDLNGTFFTGPDIGTSSKDMNVISETGNPYVFSRTRNNGGAGNSGVITAFGVYQAIKTTTEYFTGNSSLKGLSILIQGVGNVGLNLVRYLIDDEVKLYYSDTSERAIAALKHNDNIEYVHPEDVYDFPCDIFSPCADGNVLNPDTLPKLRCRAVAGAANNQLSSPEMADFLKDKGILYAPDFVINSGGAIGITGMELYNWSNEEMIREVSKIKTALEKIFKAATSKNISTHTAALEKARHRLKLTTE